MLRQRMEPQRLRLGVAVEADDAGRKVPSDKLP
jgi:hypothetical protein